MLSRRLLMASRRQNTQLTRVASYAFSAEGEQAAEPSKEEVDANRQEWGIKYDDECLKFEKEWKEIADKVESE